MQKGFTVIELMITLMVIGVLATLAIPAYQNYTRRLYYSGLIEQTIPYQTAVEKCAHKLGKLTTCTIQTNAIKTKAGISSLSVSHGILTLIPVATRGITATDTYILTPTIDKAGTVVWTPSGGAVTNEYVK